MIRSRFAFHYCIHAKAEKGVSNLVNGHEDEGAKECVAVVGMGIFLSRLFSYQDAR